MGVERQLGRSVITLALRDFASSDPSLRAKVASWIVADRNDFKQTCETVELPFESTLDFFVSIAGEDLPIRKRSVEDALSVIDAG